MEEIELVAAYININDSILIVKSASGDDNLYGKWEFPSIRKNNKNDLEYLEFMLKEELNINVQATKKITETICHYPKKEVKMELIECQYLSDDIKLKDYLDYDLIDKQELLTYDLAQATQNLAEYILENL